MSERPELTDDNKAEVICLETMAKAEYNDSRQEAIAAEEFEHNIGRWEAFKTYKKAVFWSLLASTSIVMEGYQIVLLSSFYALPAFQQKYGEYFPELDTWAIPANWQVGFAVVVSGGGVLGVLVGAMEVDRWGYRWTLIANLVLIIGCIAMVAFSPNRWVLLVGELLCAVPWGVFSTLSTAYASEVCPISLRGYLTTYINLAWVIGQLIGSGVMNGYAVKHANETMGYRLPWMLQWMWPVPIIVLLYLAPESPWWLTRRGRLEEAEQSIRRLTDVQDPGHARNAVAMMVRTNNLEKEISRGASFAACFRGTDLRRTEISTMAYGCQVFSGIVFGGSITFFFTQAGMSTDNAFKIGLGSLALAFLGTCTSWIFLSRWGRRTIFVTGMTGMTCSLLLVGVCATVAAAGHEGALWGEVAMIFVWTIFYTTTVGPLAFTIIGETSSTRLRNKTVGLARGMYNISSLVGGVINPYMISTTAWGWAGKAGFFWGGMAFLGTVWAYFRLPEMRGRSFRELDILFERRVSARKFATTDVTENDDD